MDASELTRIHRKRAAKPCCNAGPISFPAIFKDLPLSVVLYFESPGLFGPGLSEPVTYLQPDFVTSGKLTGNNSIKVTTRLALYGLKFGNLVMNAYTADRMLTGIELYNVGNLSFINFRAAQTFNPVIPGLNKSKISSFYVSGLLNWSAFDFAQLPPSILDIQFRDMTQLSAEALATQLITYGKKGGSAQINSQPGKPITKIGPLAKLAAAPYKWTISIKNI